MTNHEDYGNYKPQKPLSSRLRVSTGTNTPDKVKRHSAVTAAPQGLPEYIHPIRASGKQQGVAEGSAADFKSEVAAMGDTDPVSAMELHAIQMLVDGNEDAMDVFLMDCRPITTLNKYGMHWKSSLADAVYVAPV